MKGLVALVVLAGACSGTPLPADLARAQALERGSDDAAALAAWRKIRTACPGPGARPHDDCGVAATREAELEERLGHNAAAAAAWERVPSLTVENSRAARALERAARVRVEKLGDTPGGLADAWAAVDKYPDEVAAEDALALAVRLERARDPAALRQRLDALAARLKDDDEVADDAVVAAADVSASELGDWKGAVARYDTVDKRFKASGLRDDANYRAALLLRAHGDPQGALARLDRILSTRETAYIVGSYNAPLLDDAQLLAGEIARDDLHDAARAEKAFTTLADQYLDSTLRDDALVELAATYLGRHTPPTDEDKAAACAALVRVPKEFPDGNRVREAEKQRAALNCP